MQEPKYLSVEELKIIVDWDSKDTNIGYKLDESTDFRWALKNKNDLKELLDIIFKKINEKLITVHLGSNTPTELIVQNYSTNQYDTARGLEIYHLNPTTSFELISKMISNFQKL